MPVISETRFSLILNWPHNLLYLQMKESDYFTLLLQVEDRQEQNLGQNFMISYNRFVVLNFYKLCVFIQDLERLYPDERSNVHITLVEANEILSAFDAKLRSYTERLIRKRERMQIVKASVTSK